MVSAMQALSPFAKALAAGAVALGGAIVTAAQDGGISSGETWIIVGTTIAAVGTVFVVPNKQ